MLLKRIAFVITTNSAASTLAIDSILHVQRIRGQLRINETLFLVVTKIDSVLRVILLLGIIVVMMMMLVMLLLLADPWQQSTSGCASLIQR